MLEEHMEPKALTLVLAKTFTIYISKIFGPQLTECKKLQFTWFLCAGMELGGS